MICCAGCSMGHQQVDLTDMQSKRRSSRASLHPEGALHRMLCCLICHTKIVPGGEVERRTKTRCKSIDWSAAESRLVGSDCSLVVAGNLAWLGMAGSSSSTKDQSVRRVTSDTSPSSWGYRGWDSNLGRYYKYGYLCACQMG
jgi:hypothetical protein